jgi:Zn-dependent alcohol dehydrogenase
MAAKLSRAQAIVSHPPVDGERQWILEEVSIGRPGETEAIVEIVASGICHTDLGCGTAPDGTPGFPVPPYPRILGHEGKESFHLEDLRNSL